MEPITTFSGEHEFLSNFFPSPIYFCSDVFPTAEHFFQWYKTFNDAEATAIQNAPTPGKAKRLGHKVTLRSDWDRVKLKVMDSVVWWKFAQNPELAEKLLATGDAELIEGNN